MEQAGLKAEFERCWPRLEPALNAAGNTHTKADLLAAIEAGTVQFWPGKSAAAVTEFFCTPRAKYLNFWLLGGELRELLKMRPHIEDWARRQGCTHAMGAGRATWGRVLRGCGFQPVHTTFEKEL